MTEKQIFVSNVTDTHTTDKEGIGRMRWVGQKCYRYVYNNTGVATVVGNVYFHGTLLPGITGTTFEEEIVTLGQSGKGTAASYMAGVAVAAIPIANYGWIQIYGYNAAVQGGGGVAVVLGDSLKGVSGQTYVAKDVVTGTAPTLRRHIVALIADGTGTATVKAFIECL